MMQKPGLRQFSQQSISSLNSRFVNSAINISAHYDILNDIFSSFLSKDMTYFCAIYESKDEIVQYRKVDRVIRQAGITRCFRNCVWMGKFCYSHSAKEQGHNSNIVYRTKVLADGLQDRITVVLHDHRKYVPI